MATRESPCRLRRLERRRPQALPYDVCSRNYQKVSLCGIITIVCLCFWSFIPPDLQDSSNASTGGQPTTSIFAPSGRNNNSASRPINGDAAANASPRILLVVVIHIQGDTTLVVAASAIGKKDGSVDSKTGIGFHVSQYIASISDGFGRKGS